MGIASFYLANLTLYKYFFIYIVFVLYIVYIYIYSNFKGIKKVKLYGFTKPISTYKKLSGR